MSCGSATRMKCCVATLPSRTSRSIVLLGVDRRWSSRAAVAGEQHLAGDTPRRGSSRRASAPRSCSVTGSRGSAAASIVGRRRRAAGRVRRRARSAPRRCAAVGVRPRRRAVARCRFPSSAPSRRSRRSRPAPCRATIGAAPVDAIGERGDAIERSVDPRGGERADRQDALARTRRRPTTVLLPVPRIPLVCHVSRIVKSPRGRNEHPHLGRALHARSRTARPSRRRRSRSRCPTDRTVDSPRAPASRRPSVAPSWR